MATPVITLYAKSAVFNAVTYDGSSGGPVRADLAIGGDDFADGTGDAYWDTFIASVKGALTCRLTVAEVSRLEVPNTKSSLVLVLSSKNFSVSRTLANMVYIGSPNMVQDRAQPGSSILYFRHESGDGSTFPMT